MNGPSSTDPFFEAVGKRDDPAAARLALGLGTSDPGRLGFAAYLCCTRRLPGALAVLLEEGADPNGREEPGGRTLLHACAWEGSDECARLLAERGADPRSKTRGRLSALDLARAQLQRHGDLRFLAEAMERTVAILEVADESAKVAASCKTKPSKASRNLGP